MRLLLEETNIDASELTGAGETPVILACKNAVDIQILESLLVALRTMWPIERVKEYLDLTDASQLRAYDYAKLKKRSDLAVILEEFVDTTKSILDLAFAYVEPYDFKGTVCKSLFTAELEALSKLETKHQYLPMVEPFLKTSQKLRFDKCLAKQIKPIKFTPFLWVDSEETLKIAIGEITQHLTECNLLSADLEYHTFARVTPKFLMVIIAHKHSVSPSVEHLPEGLHHRCVEGQSACD